MDIFFILEINKYSCIYHSNIRVEKCEGQQGVTAKGKQGASKHPEYVLACLINEKTKYR